MKWRIKLPFRVFSNAPSCWVFSLPTFLVLCGHLWQVTLKLLKELYLLWIPSPGYSLCSHYFSCFLCKHTLFKGCQICRTPGLPLGWKVCMCPPPQASQSNRPVADLDFSPSALSTHCSLSETLAPSLHNVTSTASVSSHFYIPPSSEFIASVSLSFDFFFLQFLLSFPKIPKIPDFSFSKLFTKDSIPFPQYVLHGCW